MSVEKKIKESTRANTHTFTKKGRKTFKIMFFTFVRYMMTWQNNSVFLFSP